MVKFCAHLYIYDLFYPATCYDIGDDTILDGVGTIINLGMFLACVLPAPSLGRKTNAYNDGEHNENKKKLFQECANYHFTSSCQLLHGLPF